MSDGTSSPSRPTSPSASVLAANDLPTARPYRFVWDPSTRRPGPESVAGTTEGGRYGDYIVGNVQHPLGVLNNPSSMNLANGSLPVEWSSTRLGFHAISTVLNNPHKKQAPPKAHSSLPSVPPADLPRVRRKDFDSYLKAIKPEWDRYERNTQLGKEGQAHVDPTRFGAIEEEEEEDEDTNVDDGTLTIQRQRSGSTTTSTVPPSSLPIQARTIPPLDTVPQVFFHPDFNLGDARTFDAVTEQSSLASLATPTQANIRTISHDSSREDEDDPTDPLSISHTLPLLEKFDHYADTVEQHLIREISLRSTSFFAALTNLRDLQTSSTQCLSRIQNLRQKLKEVDEGTAKKGLELVRVKAKQDKVQEVREGVKMVEGVVEMMGVLKGLVGAGQWGEALNIVDAIEGMWERERDEVEVKKVNGNANVPNGSRLDSMAEEEETDEGALGAPPSRNGHGPSAKAIPLSSLKAFGAIPSHLRTITMDIAASLSAELVAVLKDDWILYVEAREAEAPKAETRDGPSPNGTTAKADGSGEDKKADAINQGLRDRLRPLLLNLVRTKGLKEGMLSWREVIQGEVKALVSKKLPGLDAESEGSDGNDEVRAGLANHLRNLSQEDFMALMKGIYRTLMNGIERLKSQGEILSDMLEALKPELPKRRTPRATSASSSNSQSKAPSSTPSLPQIPPIEEDLNDFLSSSCELANTTAAKVVAFRSEKHAKLELPEFMDFFNTSWAFVVRCEVISKRMIIGLRGTVVSQAKLWLQTFHQARISQSAKLVEDEVWNPCPVTREVQRMTDIIIDSAVKDSPELIIDLTKKTLDQSPGDTSKEVNGTSSQGDGSTNPPPTAKTPATPSKPSATTPLRIEDRTYFTVKATLDVLELLLDYLKVVVNMNMLTTDTMSRVIEFLKAFNSRTCQVVLGAGAMKSAGLKNITAKHLALASQSLSVVFELIPYVRETFRRHLSQKQAVMLVEFDKLKRDYQEHQNEIHAKLVAIMADRLTAHIKALHTIDWNATSPEGSVNTYMVSLVKETVQLHKILSRYLPLPVVEFVMSQVLAAINHRLSEEYGKIELRDQQAKNRLLEDARYLNQHFSTLKNIRAPTAMLETVVAEKMLPRPAGAQVPQTPSRANTLTANQRLKGLLSGRGSSFLDKTLPQPSRTPTPPVPPPADTKLQPPSMSLGNGSNNGPSALGIDGSVSGSSASLILSPPIETAGGPGGGFRQLDGVNSTEPAEINPTPSTSVSASPPPPPPKADGSRS